LHETLRLVPDWRAKGYDVGQSLLINLTDEKVFIKMMFKYYPDTTTNNTDSWVGLKRANIEKKGMLLSNAIILVPYMRRAGVLFKIKQLRMLAFAFGARSEDNNESIAKGLTQDVLQIIYDFM